MPTNFPGALDSYTNKVDGVDTVQAAHVNNLQDAVAAIENAFISPATWTPVLSSSGTPPTVTYTDRSGRSFRIGNLVYVHCYIYAGNISAVGTGNIRITGLPVASNSFCALSMGISNILNTDTGYVPWVSGNAIELWYAGGANVPVSNLLTGTAGYLVCTGFYHI